MSFTNYAAQAILNALVGKSSAFGSLSARPTLYVGLSTTAPSESGGNVTEPSGNGYARVQTSPSDWNSATLADPSVVSNANAIGFPSATGPWGNCTHFVIFDAAVAGSVIASGQLVVQKSPTSGDTPTFEPGALVWELD